MHDYPNVPRFGRSKKHQAIPPLIPLPNAAGALESKASQTICLVLSGRRDRDAFVYGGVTDGSTSVVLRHCVYG